MKTDVAIVGAGFAGLGMAIALKREGLSDFVLLEQSDGIGGTWRANSYPGCACDVQSHLYSFSHTPNPKWSRMYAPAEEIREYMERCVDDHGIRPNIRLGARFTHARWDDEAAHWEIEVNGSETITARVLVPALGGLSRPSYPEIEGLEEFRGRTFHSAEWDHDYDLEGKRVAVVGTGASAIQFVPRIAGQVRELHLFQRTPPWVLPQPDRAISGFEQKLFERVPAAQRALRGLIYSAQESIAVGLTLEPRLMKAGEAIGRRYIGSQIEDPELRAAVTPDYRLGCKRILISNRYYRSLARENVSLVTSGITRATATGVVDGAGTEREVDAIVFGTGFRPTDLFTPLTIEGRGGRDLNEVWSEHLSAHLGTTVSGFPNMFLLVGPNTGTGHNSQLFMIECQIRYAMAALRTMRSRGARAVDVRPEVQESFNARLRQRLRRTVWSTGGCSSWYLDSSGRNTTLWPGFTFQFARATRSFDPGSHDLIPAPQPVPTREEVAA